MNVADQILEAAQRVLSAKTEFLRASDEYEAAQSAYRQLIATKMGQALATNDDGEMAAASKESLRDRILQYMHLHPGVPLTLADIEKATRGQCTHRKVLWTLANLRRDDKIVNESKGVYSVPKTNEEERIEREESVINGNDPF
jgi:hypothetical protein